MKSIPSSSFITVLYKGKGKDKSRLKSYRPISITPASYRVLTKAIQLKLAPVVTALIGDTQVAYIADGRQIYDNTLLLAEVAWANSLIVQPTVVSQMSASRPHGLDVQSDDDHDEWPDIDLTDDMAAAERSAADVEEIGALAVRTHRERDDPTTNDNADNPASSSSSPSYNSSEDEEFQSFSGDVFVRHRVHQKDTLASLAVRYNVSISDIKRTNAYQNDSALYGKEWVIIPKKPLPIDLELLGDVYNKTLCSPRGVRTLMVAHMEYLDDDERDAARLRASERRDGHGREREGTVEVELMRTTMA